MNRTAILINLLILTIVFYVSCTKMNNNEVNEIYNSRSKILYFERDFKGNINEADIILINLEDRKTFLFSKNTSSRFSTQMSESGRYIASFNDNFPHYGKFRIYDLKLNKNWIIRLQNLEGQMGAMGITDFGFLNDSTVIFSVFDNFYVFLIKEEEAKLYKNTSNKYIYNFIVDSNGEKIAFSFFENYKTIDKTKLALFYIVKDSIKSMDFSVFNLGNWSPDNDKFIFSSIPHNYYIIDTNLKLNNKLSFGSELESQINQVLFFSKDTLLINISQQSSRQGSDLFLYSTVDNKVVRQLTFNQSIKYNIVVFNK